MNPMLNVEIETKSGTLTMGTQEPVKSITINLLPMIDQAKIQGAIDARVRMKDAVKHMLEEEKKRPREEYRSEHGKGFIVGIERTLDLITEIINTSPCLPESETETDSHQPKLFTEEEIESCNQPTK